MTPITLSNGSYSPKLFSFSGTDSIRFRLLFRWLAIPWLQAELDSWVIRFNSTPRRHDKNKILPHGIPDLITSKPHLYGTKDYKVRASLV